MFFKRVFNYGSTIEWPRLFGQIVQVRKTVTSDAQSHSKFGGGGGEGEGDEGREKGGGGGERKRKEEEEKEKEKEKKKKKEKKQKKKNKKKRTPAWGDYHGGSVLLPCPPTWSRREGAGLPENSPT